MTDLKPILSLVAEGTPLTETQAEDAFSLIMEGQATHSQLGAFLMGLRVRGETVDELTGAARVMRAKALPVSAPPGAIDTCGTGGDAKGTYNISTAVALVTAACGVPVAKHGNKAMSSKSGTSDVIAHLGANLQAEVPVLEACLKEANIAFLFAQKHHAAMKHVAPVRQELGIRVIFNLIGPLSNPAKAKRQLMGVFDAQWVEPLAHVLKNLGSERVWVAHGSDGLDELTTTGSSQVAELKNGAVQSFEVHPEDAGLPVASLDDLKGGDVATNAAALQAVLANEPSAYRDIVLFNTAAALMVADKTSSLKDGVALAADAIASGRAAETLSKLVAVSNGQSA